MMRFLALFILCFYTGTASAEGVRIKDITNIRGFRSNQLTGFGLVIGLSGSGDSASSLMTNKAVKNMLTRLGMQSNEETVANASVAAVIVTADLPAFKRNGDRISVKVSTIGDAASLAGGTLLMTPLKAGDGKVYVVAQGSVVVGQATGSGAKVLTTALIPNAGVVEREFQPTIAPNGKLILSLKVPDFTTNSRVADEINGYFKGFFAKAIDPVTVEVDIPPLFVGRVVEFVAEVEMLKVAVDQRAVVVLNERTGTVVMGSKVSIGSVTISHGSLSIQIGENEKEGAAGPQTVVNVGGATVGELVETINALGVKPEDLVGILQAVHAAGALRADLKFM